MKKKTLNFNFPNVLLISGNLMREIMLNIVFKKTAKFDFDMGGHCAREDTFDILFYN